MREGWRFEVAELNFAKRYGEALVFVQEAVKEGDMAAHVMLAIMGDNAGLSRGEVDQLIDYVEANMDPRDVEAHLELRGAYDIGLGNLPYEEKAARRFSHHLKAVELGAGAFYTLALARVYLIGAIAVEPDWTQAIRWYKRAIQQGSVEAAHELQQVYKQQELEERSK
jgi:TPR repeat protein